MRRQSTSPTATRSATPTGSGPVPPMLDLAEHTKGLSDALPHRREGSGMKYLMFWKLELNMSLKLI
ncbi:hypothetical protein EJB05_42765 [Eragrostis curvula]|uniref:Uncharacterized protein n=1 Tax=Eragrostis curvula TaxID=38414 RepID=A0A5J9TDE9_9POAL|nr:hypothetical protein EJB05_42765 [Eragrostis curvula]